MDKTHPISTPFVVQSCEAMKIPFHRPDNEETLNLEIPYLSAINAQMYLTTYKTWHSIFSQFASKIVQYHLDDI